MDAYEIMFKHIIRLQGTEFASDRDMQEWQGPVNPVWGALIAKLGKTAAEDYGRRDLLTEQDFGTTFYLTLTVVPNPKALRDDLQALDNEAYEKGKEVARSEAEEKIAKLEAKINNLISENIKLEDQIQSFTVFGQELRGKENGPLNAVMGTLDAFIAERNALKATLERVREAAESYLRPETVMVWGEYDDGRDAVAHKILTIIDKEA